VLPVVLILVAYHNRKRKLALRDFGQLSMARVTASSSRVQHGKNSTTTYQDLSIQVLVGGRYLPVSRSLARKQPVPLGVYPCLVDPQSPQRVSIQLDPLAQNLR
jgi:hypothetical protein